MRYNHKAQVIFASMEMDQRRHSGYSLVELPAGVWLLLIAFLFPFISYTTLGYRAALMYFAAYDACTKSARSLTFSTASTAAQQTFAADSASFTGIESPAEMLYVIEQPYALPGNPQPPANVYGQAPKSVNTSQNAYFLQVVATAKIHALIEFGPDGLMGLQIPGLTVPYPLQVVCKVYSENPQGLTN